MTTIIAVENSDHVIIGCDSQVTRGYEKSSLSAGKIVVNGEYRIAVAGRARMLQAMRHATLPIPPRNVENIDKFVGTVLAKSIVDAEIEAGCEPGESYYLFVVRGRVYNIGGDGTYIRVSDGRYSIGSGSSYALGALHTIKGEPTVDDVQSALQAAAKHDIGTAGPFYVEKV